MKFDLKQIEAFVWVSDLGSFKKAAERLSTTQPNISARIARLEATLETVLMDRDAGSVRLTPRGVELLSHARCILREADRFAEAANQHTMVVDVVRLGVTEMIVHTWLQSYLQAFRSRFPGVVLEITVDLSAKIETELADRNIDLALQNRPFERDISGSVSLGIYPLGWVASPALGLHDRPKLGAQDLLKHPILAHARGTRPYREVLAHLSAASGQKPRLVPSSNMAACIQMAVDGFGVSAVPLAMIQEQLAKGELVELSYEWVPENLDFYARFDADRAGFAVKEAADIAGQVSTEYLQQCP